MFFNNGNLLFGSLFVHAIFYYLLAGLVFFKSKNKEKLVFSLYCMFVGLWTVSIVFFGIFNIEQAIIWNKLFIASSGFIPATLLHFVYLFNKEKVYTYTIIGIYLPVLIIIVQLIYFPQQYIKKIIFQTWGKENIFGDYYLFGWYSVTYASFTFLKIFLRYLSVEGVDRHRCKYLLSAMVSTALLGAYFNLFLILIGNYKYIWVGPYCSFIMVFVIAYTIVKYRLMDIKLAITKAGIFIVVYTLVLGIPFFAGLQILGVGFWLLPTTLMAVFATVGPFVYLHFQRKVEEKLLANQHQYQFTLRRASLGMGRIKDLKKLLMLIVHVVTRTVRIEHCSIYLFHEASNQFILKASKGIKKINDKQSAFSADSSLIKYLKKFKEPLVHEEIKERSKDYNDENLKEVEKIIASLKTELIIPSYIEDKMLAVIALGKKRSGKLYTQEDLVVFSILANQSALAIENAQFYETTKKTHEQLFKAEKMATIGTMADGLSHQINNRLHAMGFIAGDILDTIKITRKNGVSKKTDKVLKEIAEGLHRIEDNVLRGGEIVEGLLKYTRKGTKGFEAVDIDKLISAAVEMAQFKIKISDIDIHRNYNGNTPKVRGNFTQLQEVFFNIIDNSYDAMIQRKEERKEGSYRGVIDINAVINGTTLEIALSDNGMGVRDADKSKLFTPFFTTKLSSRKGTGLGLYVIRQIIEENHKGKVIFISEYGVGTQTRILLPIAKM